jgi:hypothetical protein
MTEARDVGETEGTISIPADWYVEGSRRKRRLILTIDLADVITDIAGADWQFDTVPGVGSGVGTDLTLRYVSNEG